MSKYDYDYIVVGGGSGGIASARRAASYGARVLVIEKGPLGGTCVNVGCVPKKIMWQAAHFAHQNLLAEDYGFQPREALLDWGTLKEKRDAYIKRLNQIYQNNLLKSGVTVVHGMGTLIDDSTVSVEGKAYRAPHILIAVGGVPLRPEIAGADHGLTSNDFFELTTCPKTCLIAGSGYIALELAGVLQALGCKVDLLIRTRRVLRSFDEPLSEHLLETLRLAPDGPHIHQQTTIHSVEKTKSGVRCHLEQGESLEAEQLIWAVGREPLLKPLGLERLGLAPTPTGGLAVDAYQNTEVKGIYAVGDVTQKKELTPVAIAAGRRLADRLFGGQENAHLDYGCIPTVVFTHPPLGTVGLSEQEAVEQHGKDAIRVYESKFTNLMYSLSEYKPKTYMRLITLLPSEKILGLHVVGDGADEMLQGFAVAVKMGATKQDFDRTVAIHPSASEEFVTMT